MSYEIRFCIRPEDDPTAAGEWRQITISSELYGMSYRDAVASVASHVPKGSRVIAVAGGQFGGVFDVPAESQKP